MKYDQNYRLPSQRRKHDWISYMFPLGFLLIFAFTQSLAGLLTSLAIILLLWVLLAADSSSPRRQQTPFMSPPLMQQPAASPYEPEAERPYEQGYLGAWNTRGQTRQGPDASGEGDRLAQLQLLGELYHAGKLTEDEFTRQKKQILQDDVVREATEPEATPAPVFELEYEEPSLVPTHKSSLRNTD